MTTALLLLAAAGLSAQTAPPPETTEAAPPPLITSTEIQAGDSPLVVAAKRAMAARLKAKDRINVAVTPGKGHIFQATGPVNPSFKMPPEDPKPKPAKKTPVMDTAALERKLQRLLQEQERLASQGDEPVDGDGSEEDYTDNRSAALQKEIDDLRRQISQLQGKNPSQ